MSKFSANTSCIIFQKNQHKETPIQQYQCWCKKTFNERFCFLKHFLHDENHKDFHHLMMKRMETIDNKCQHCDEEFNANSTQDHKVTHYLANHEDIVFDDSVKNIFGTRYFEPTLMAEVNVFKIDT